ncbi:MAG: HEPN domain-containing protein [Chloroflexi bacterium]|nr:HEPN domain-containing protein [Chloroflexota bacterium]
MSTPQTSAENFLREASKLSDEAEAFLRNLEHYRALEFSQRSVEFSIKSVLLRYGVTFQYTHHPAPDLRKVVGLPEWFKRKVPQVELYSRLLSAARSYATYGDVELAVPPGEIIDQKLAQFAVAAAWSTYSDCSRLSNEVTKTS